MITPELKHKLKQIFPTNLHQLRDLPGGGIYAFITWQNVRERLDEICDWEIEYCDPILIDDLCIIRCTLTIQGTKRQGVGNASVIKTKIGNFAEAAIADSFKNAAEQFGLGAYLDDPEMQRQLKGDRVLVDEYQKRTGKAIGIYAKNAASSANSTSPTAQAPRKSLINR